VKRLLACWLLIATGVAAEPLAPAAPVHEPDLQRPRLRLPAIDSEDLALGAYLGMMSVEDFGSSALRGVSLAWYPAAGWFLEASLSRAQVADSDFRRLGIALFPSERVTLANDGLVLGYDLLPGEVFLGRGRAFVSAAYLLGGAGLTRFAGERWFTLTLGMGLRLLVNDTFALQLESRAHQFRGSLLGVAKYSHNVETRLAATVFF